MDALTYGLSQRIGIFYLDNEWKDKVFQDVLNHYPEDWFIKIQNGKQDCFLQLKDETTIKFVPATTSARGGCYSKIILQPGIGLNTIQNIILPQLKHQNRQIMILKDNEEGIDLTSV